MHDHLYTLFVLKPITPFGILIWVLLGFITWLGLRITRRWLFIRSRFTELPDWVKVYWSILAPAVWTLFGLAVFVRVVFAYPVPALLLAAVAWPFFQDAGKNFLAGIRIRQLDRAERGQAILWKGETVVMQEMGALYVQVQAHSGRKYRIPNSRLESSVPAFLPDQRTREVLIPLPAHLAPQDALRLFRKALIFNPYCQAASQEPVIESLPSDERRIRATLMALSDVHLSVGEAYLSQSFSVDPEENCP